MRIAIGIEYQGGNYCGWQSQKGLPSIQATLESALSKVANHPIKLFCAGRTDIGVHALGQVAHFDTTSLSRRIEAWVLGCNTYLPPEIKIRWAQQVSEDFHARFSATARHYRYIIYNSRVPSGLFNQLVACHQYPLQENLMQEAANFLLGERDFSSFRGSGCQSRTAMRNIEFIRIQRLDNIITIDIKANAFLLHMVRNIVGVLLEVGSGRKDPHWAEEVLLARDRRAAANTAPAEGLYLLSVDYPEKYGLPNNSNNLNFAINIA